ncbi:hypothetical protein [Pendulispora albinea]|uniref:Uncharacterized protein n=1 Tax=Pendulispora albinea TaxID=2741071 RepID=A0ABZ2LPA5_9BACT
MHAFAIGLLVLAAGFGAMACLNARSRTEGDGGSAAPILQIQRGGPDDLLDDPPAAPTPPTKPATQLKTCAARDGAAGKAEWERARKQRPFHVQAIGLSAPLADGCRTLIVFEPPPGTTVDRLIALAPAVLRTYWVLQHPVGFDGWVRDIVFTIPPLGEDAGAELIASLHLELFGTTYGADILDTSKRVIRRPIEYDLKIGPSELAQWLLDENPTVSAIAGGSLADVATLLGGRQSGVFVTGDSALVIWALPRNHQKIAKAEAREFAVASDLIVGALSSGSSLLIVARGRQMSFDELAPLRFETLAMLASTSSAELAQSYERMNIFAGRFDLHRDWAPILLSPELVDTEYGSLLNVTDQILKSWSNAGQTHYIRFDYPVPHKWPFQTAVPKQLRASTLTYNWNTKSAGAAVALAEDGREVFWLRRTGALNVTYLPEQENATKRTDDVDPANASAVSLAELAYDGFAASHDPYLTRVVQYNALYQIFRHFRAPAGATETQATHPLAAIATRLQPAAAALLTKLTDAPPPVLEAAVTKAIHDLASDLQRHHLANASPRLRAFVAAFPSLEQKVLGRLKAHLGVSLRAKYMNELKSVQDAVTSLSDHDRESLTFALASGRPPLRGSARVAALHGDILEQREVIQGLIDVSEVMRSYQSAFTPTPDAWVHTPSVVVSWNEGGMTGSSGGHNLDSALARIGKSANLAPAGRDGLIKVNRLALAGVRLDASGIATGPTIAPRPLTTALGIVQAKGAVLPASKQHALGWRPLTADVGRTKPAGHIGIARQTGGYRVAIGGAGDNYETSTMSDVVELIERHPVSEGRAVQLELDGFTPDEARGFVKSVELRSRAKISGVLEADKELAGLRLDFSKATVFEPRVSELRGGVARIGMAVEVPVRGQPSVWMRIKLFVRGLTPEALARVVEDVKAAVLRVVQRAAGGQAAASDVATDLRTELGVLLGGDGKVEIRIRKEATDIIILQAPKRAPRTPGSNGRSDRVPA